MKEFILANWKYLICAAAFLFVTIVTLIPKKVKTLDTIKEVILANLPKFIDMVERPGDGREKMKEVIELCLAFITKLYPGVQANQYISFIRSSVEAILNTPQKKG